MKGIKHKNPMQTRHGRPRYKAYSITQLLDAYEKTSVPKAKEKILNMLNYKSKKKDRKSTRLNSSHTDISRMPSSA